MSTLESTKKVRIRKLFVALTKYLHPRVFADAIEGSKVPFLRLTPSFSSFFFSSSFRLKTKDRSTCQQVARFWRRWLRVVDEVAVVVDAAEEVAVDATAAGNPMAAICNANLSFSAFNLASLPLGFFDRVCCCCCCCCCCGCCGCGDCRCCCGFGGGVGFPAFFDVVADAAETEVAAEDFADVVAAADVPFRSFRRSSSAFFALSIPSAKERIFSMSPPSLDHRTLD